jgi:DNA-binding SARP family transcriptional activator/Tfp pilus assembly protein PilF
VEFLLLGPLIVRSNGEVLPVQRGKQRAVLAVLLLHANRIVSVDQLAEFLWDGEKPLSAQVTVQNYVKRVRQALGDRDHSLISTQPHGYVINVEPSELDVSQFRALLKSAQSAARQGSWEAAAEQASVALTLWRGEPLADVESELLQRRDAPRLAEMLLQAEETRIDASLHLGRHAELIGDLRRLTASHPLRERFWALLMLALFRSGRQADALAAYQQARTALVDQLGAEPGAELRQVHSQVLAGDDGMVADGQPSLAARAADAPPSAPPAAVPPEVAAPPQPQQALAVPWQLPAPVRHFTGRSAELAQLSEMLGRDAEEANGLVVISAIDGTAGVGKTAFAVHWAHQAAANFPDGQLYVNLRGFGRSAPMSPAEAVSGFLAALGVPFERWPPGFDAQVGLYRSVVAGRRLLIVLDNARDVEQVRTLLPGSPGCLVLVTSRASLAGLAVSEGAHLLTLDVLPEDEAGQLLCQRIGSSRVTAEPGAMGELIRLCAGLPLALAIVAARACARPSFPLANLAAELSDESSRLDALDAGDPASSVRAVISWSYESLTKQAARMFRLLGLHPGPDVTALAAASAAGVELPAARRCLRELTQAHLLTERRPGRYSFHDLLRAYAASQAHATDGRHERHEAMLRALDHYLHTAYAAALLLQPTRDPIALAALRPGAVPEYLAGDAEAMAWFEREHHVLLAAITVAADAGFDVHAWQIPWTMTTFLGRRGYWQQWAASQGIAVAAATRLGDAAGQAESCRLLANACSRLGDYDQASFHLGHCLRLYRRLRDQVGEARTYQSLGMIAERQSRYSDALTHYEQSLRQFQVAGHQVGQAEELNNLGWCHAILGDYRQARAFCQQALTLSSEIGHRDIEASAWDSLGYAEHHLGNLREATTCYQRALSLFRERGDRFYQALTLTHIGDVGHASGEIRRARDAWREALDIFEDLHHPDADKVRAKLRAPVQTVAASH